MKTSKSTQAVFINFTNNSIYWKKNEDVFLHRF